MTYKYRVDILRNKIVIGHLNATDIQVHYDSNASIKRSASITADLRLMDMQKIYKKTGSASTITFVIPSVLTSNIHSETYFEFDSITDRLMPVVTIDGIDYPQGIFMVCSMPTKVEKSYVYSEIECYDETYILDQSVIPSRLYYSSGTKYIDVIEDILLGSGITNIIADETVYTLNSDREFSIGDKKLEIINTFLSEIGFNELFSDGKGYMHIQKKTKTLKPDWIYKDDSNSILSMQMQKQKDIYSIPNVFIGTVSNPDVSSMTYKKVNDNILSELSTAKRGYELTKVYKFDDIATEAELKSYVDDEYVKSMMATESISFETSIDGSHGHKENIQINTAEISGLYQETAWDLSSDGTLSHTAERVVIE